jgi:hypothetical protein
MPGIRVEHARYRESGISCGPPRAVGRERFSEFPIGHDSTIAWSRAAHGTAMYAKTSANYSIVCRWRARRATPVAESRLTQNSTELEFHLVGLASNSAAREDWGVKPFPQLKAEICRYE